MLKREIAGQTILRAGVDCRGDDVSGREFGVGMHVAHKSVAVLGHEVGAVSAHRLGDQKGSFALCQGGGVKLDELHSGNPGSGGDRDRDAVSGRAGRVGRPLVQRARTARCQQRHGRSHVDQLVAMQHPGSAAPLPVGDQPDRRGVLEHSDQGFGADTRDQPLGDRRSGGAAPGVQDPVYRRDRLRDRGRTRRRSSDRTRRPAAPDRRIRSTPSSTSTRTAAGSQSPRPAVMVSAKCRSGESPAPIAAATPPWAMNELEARSPPLVISVTVAPSEAA